MSSWISDEAEAFEAAERPLSARAMAARPAPYLDDLNPDQRAAVEALDGPVLVLAGAGTGKTKALTARIAHLLNTGRARPNEILAVTFTNKAAREMRTRVGQLVGHVIEGMPWLGTFHSLSVRILRRHAELVGLKSNFTILDTDDQIRLLRQIVLAANVDEKRWPPRLLASLIDSWKNRALLPERVPSSEASAFDHRGSELYAEYQDLDDVPPHFLKEMEHFFRIYKDLEEEKHTVVHGWRPREEVRAIVEDAVARYARAPR